MLGYRFSTNYRLLGWHVMLLAICALPVSADTIHVPADFPTIQAAIDAAADGDEVVIAPDTYTGWQNRDLDFNGPGRDNRIGAVYRDGDVGPGKISMLRLMGKVLVGLGAAGLVGATAWWYMFFEQMLGLSVKRASECFYTTTTECEIGVLIGGLGDVPAYTPAALWLSVAVLVLGVAVYGLSPRKTPDEPDADRN